MPLAAESSSRYFYDHLAEPFDLQRAASHFNVTPSHLARGAKRHLGQPLGKTAVAVKLERDVMLTLLDLAGLEIPASVEGHSMIGEHRRELLYGEVGEIGPGTPATRMMHDGRHKLIYYPEGHHLQLFDLEQDPAELHDLSQASSYASVRQRLTGALTQELYGADEACIANGQLIGTSECQAAPLDRRALQGQRGVHYPMP